VAYFWELEWKDKPVTGEDAITVEHLRDEHKLCAVMIALAARTQGWSNVSLPSFLTALAALL
jgi:hypothetical protein